MSDWQPIETAFGDDPVLLWCSDQSMDTFTRRLAPRGIVMGRVIDGRPYGNGMNGDWTFTHWMPLPAPPDNQ